MGLLQIKFAVAVKARMKTLGINAKDLCKEMVVSESYLSMVIKNRNTFQPFTGRVLSKALQWDRLAISIILQVIYECKQCKAVSEFTIYDEWTAKYVELTFLSKIRDETFNDALLTFLAYGGVFKKDTRREKKLQAFLLAHPDFIKLLKEANKVFGIENY